jgi:hypothetical protein
VSLRHADGGEDGVAPRLETRETGDTSQAMLREEPSLGRTVALGRIARPATRDDVVHRIETALKIGDLVVLSQPAVPALEFRRGATIGALGILHEPAPIPLVKLAPVTDDAMS